MGVVWPALTPQGKDRPGNVRGALSYAGVMVRRVVPAACSIAAVACDDACDPLAVAAAATPAAATTPPPTKSFRAAFMARSFQEGSQWRSGHRGRLTFIYPGRPVGGTGRCGG